MTRVFYRDSNGKNLVWNGQPTVYGGQKISQDWLAEQQRTWATPGSARMVGDVFVLVYDDGAVQLDKFKAGETKEGVDSGLRKQWFFPFKNPRNYKVDTCHGDTTYPTRFAQYHSGLDINGVGGGNTDKGDPFVAIADGQVVFVSDHAGGAWGGLVVVAHPQFGPHIYSRYGHHLPGSAQVKVGDMVRGGETVLACIGCGERDAYLAHSHVDVLQVTPPLSRSGRIWWAWWPNNDLREFNRAYLNLGGLFRKCGTRTPAIPNRQKAGVL